MTRMGWGLLLIITLLDVFGLIKPSWDGVGWVGMGREPLLIITLLDASGWVAIGTLSTFYDRDGMGAVAYHHAFGCVGIG